MNTSNSRAPRVRLYAYVEALGGKLVEAVS
jgi:hypothetical protein